MAKSPEIIDAQAILSRWYGPNSIVCHTVRIIDDKAGEAKFSVGQNFCGLNTRPPMLDRLLVQNGVFTTKTTTGDAKEHFIDSVGIKVIPGHNIMALAAEAMRQSYNPNQRKGELYVVGFDFMRFSEVVVPGQNIAFTGRIEKDETGAIGTFNMSGSRRPFTRNFRIEEAGTLTEEERNQVLAQHWLFEANAQGMGILGLQNAEDNVVPVLMEAGKSTFAKIPTLAGQTLVSRLEILSADDKQILGQASTYVEDHLVASQQDLLLQFVPVEIIKERIENIKGGI